MCQLKSGIILKDRVFVPEYDSHSKMLEELGIEDNYLNASKTFVRAELSPKDNDVFSDIDKWELRVDQDITPEWWDEDSYKPLMVEKVKEWAKTHIHIGITGLKIDRGENHYIKDCKDVEVFGSATVNEVCGSATVKWVFGSATVNEVFGSATVNEVCGSATVVSALYSPWANSDKIILCDNATFKDCYTKTIYQSGDWKLVKVEEK